MPAGVCPDASEPSSTSVTRARPSLVTAVGLRPGTRIGLKGILSSEDPTRMLCRRFLAVWAGLFTLALLVSGCSPAKSSTPPPAASPTPTQVLWGDMKPIVSVKELMRYMIDPASDNIFDAVKIVQTK